MISPAVVKELLAAGVTGDALVTALERIAEAEKPARSKGAERTARYRQRQKEASQVTHDTSHVTPTLPPMRDITLPPTQDSEAKASGANAPRDERTELFRKGLADLAALTGKPASSLRSLIGRWLRAANDDCLKLNRLIEDACLHRPADPAAWIEGAIRSRGPPGGDREGFGTIALRLQREIDERDRNNASASHDATGRESGFDAGPRRGSEWGGGDCLRDAASAGQGARTRSPPDGRGQVIDLVAESRRTG